MNLRSDPAANALMAGAFTRSNGDRLAERLGRAPSEGELYIAHFLGPNGAGRLIGLAESQPGVSAADAFPGRRDPTRGIFHDRQGRARSVGEVYQSLVGRYGVARGAPAKHGDGGGGETPATWVLAPLLEPSGPASASRRPNRYGQSVPPLYCTGWRTQAKAIVKEEFSFVPAERTHDVPPALKNTAHLCETGHSSSGTHLAHDVSIARCVNSYTQNAITLFAQ